MISSLHGLYDDRIYWKEALSLIDHGYEVTHITTGTGDRDFVSEHGIRLIQVNKKQYFRNPYLDIVFRKLAFRRNIYKRILRICSSLQADVYHFHDVQINRIGPLLKQLPHAPGVIYDVHEDFSDLLLVQHPGRGLMRALLKIYTAMLNRWELSRSVSYDHIIVVVEHLRNKFIVRVNPDKVSVIYNFTALSPVSIKPFAEKKYDAVYCGQISKNRGALQILEAAKLLRDPFPKIRILLLGPIPDHRFRLQLESFIRINDLQQNIILHGNVSYHEMEGFYQDSRIGLGVFLPVSIFYYGIQIKMFEYMTYGLPVVCSNFGNINRFVTETESGIPVDPMNPGEIAGAITDLLTDRSLYKKLSENGTLAIRQKYNWRSEETKLLEIYDNLTKTTRDVPHERVIKHVHGSTGIK
ncbi:MAG TPA: glycosyltransferase family 4 protein [Bacteroidales bacterium]|nr:glycosyltransferase family 4 protein [Bacteroidales bacterium]